MPLVNNVSARGFGSKDNPDEVDKSGPNTDQLPHVSEEAAKVAEITGKNGPDLEQGTPIEEVRKVALLSGPNIYCCSRSSKETGKLRKSSPRS